MFAVVMILFIFICSIMLNIDMYKNDDEFNSWP